MNNCSTALNSVEVYLLQRQANKSNRPQDRMTNKHSNSKLFNQNNIQYNKIYYKCYIYKDSNNAHL